MRKIVLCILLFIFQYSMAESIKSSYDLRRDSLTFTGEGSLEQKHVKQALAKYPRTKIVYVGGNVSSVGYNAFKGCNNVETILFSPSVKGNGFAPVCDCRKLSKVVLPDNWKIISCLLSNCPNLESFVVPDSVSVIKELSEKCPFKSLHIGKNVREIVGDYGIQSKRLSHISVSSGNKLFFSQDGVLYTYYPGVMHYIENSYFKSQLKKDIRIVKYPPEKRDSAFYFNYPTIGGISNKYLREIRLGSEVRKWERCSVPSMSRFMVDDANDFFSVSEDVLFDKAGKCLVAYPSAKKGNKYVIPSCVEKLGSYAFVNCQFDTLVCPASVKIVHRAAICYCEKLRCVEMHWQNPNEVSFDSHLFDGINTSEVTLKVPKDTKNLYIELFNNRMGYQFMVEE